MRKGISGQGFKRLASFIQAQAWGGDEVVGTEKKHYVNAALENFGGVMFFSDGAKTYGTGGMAAKVIAPDGSEVLYTEDPETYDFYEGIRSEYRDYVPQSAMLAADQEDFNAIMGTGYEVVELSEEEAQAATEMFESGVEFMADQNAGW